MEPHEREQQLLESIRYLGDLPEDRASLNLLLNDSKRQEYACRKALQRVKDDLFYFHDVVAAHGREVAELTDEQFKALLLPLSWLIVDCNQRRLKEALGKRD